MNLVSYMSPWITIASFYRTLLGAYMHFITGAAFKDNNNNNKNINNTVFDMTPAVY